MNVEGMLTPAEVFMVLFNRAKTDGLGIMHFMPRDMKLEEAQKTVREMGTNTYVDYFQGRVMKINIARRDLDTVLYNLDNGPDAAEDALMDYLTAPKKSGA